MIFIEVLMEVNSDLGIALSNFVQSSFTIFPKL